MTEARLRAVVGSLVVAIEHVGSTAVPRLVAKPILDIALAAARKAILVSGDKHLLDLADQVPVLDPARFRERLFELDIDTGN